jgi:hypothetical protein
MTLVLRDRRAFGAPGSRITNRKHQTCQIEASGDIREKTVASRAVARKHGGDAAEGRSNLHKKWAIRGRL